MQKNKSFFYSLFLTGFLMILSLPLQAWDFNLCEPLDITAEARVAYYHPSSKRVRHIYGSGWADYQFELSKGFRGLGVFGLEELGGLEGLSGRDIDWRLWVGVSGFSRKGDSRGFHDRTRLDLIPINFGLKIFYPIFCNTKIYVGGGGSYSFLRIRDHSEFVHKHTRKEDWGGLVQSGITYNFYDWAVVSCFFDYYFQRFHFHDKHHSSRRGSTSFYDDRFIKRSDLDMSGYKIGVSLGVTF